MDVSLELLGRPASASSSSDASESTSGGVGGGGSVSHASSHPQQARNQDSDPRLTMFMPPTEPLSPIPPTPKEIAPAMKPVPEPQPELEQQPERPPSAAHSTASSAGQSDEVPVDLRHVIAKAKSKGREPKEVMIPGVPGSIDPLPSGGSTTSASARVTKSKNWAVHGSLRTQNVASALQQSRRTLIAEKKIAERSALKWKPDLKNLPSEYERARKDAVRLFKSIDADGNGFVTKKEVHAAMLARGVDMDNHDVAEMMQAAESDGDGVLNCDEYVTMVLQAKKQREEQEAVDPTVKKRMAKLKDKEKKLAEHWDMLGSDVKTYGEDDGSDEYDGGMGSGMDGGGSFLGSLSPNKKNRKGRRRRGQNATWQNSLGDFAAFPLIFLKSCWCPCVQFGLNGAEILEPECAACHANSNCCAHHIVPPHRHGDLCLPLALGWMLLCPLVATIGGGCARFRLRRQLGIDGSAWQDCAVHLCCCCCAMIQEGAELGHERVRRQAEAQAKARDQRLGMRSAQPVENSMS